MNNGTKLTAAAVLATAAAVLATAGIGAIAGGYAWFPMGSGSQLALVGAGSVLSAIGFVTAMHHWMQSEATGHGSAIRWTLTDPMLLPSCGAVLIAGLLVMAGIFCFITSILYGWDAHPVVGITLAVMAGICFGTAFVTIRYD